jgi:hypothetical protein
MLRPCPAHDRGEAPLRGYVHPAGLQVTAPLHQPLFSCASSGWVRCAHEAPPAIEVYHLRFQARQYRMELR